MLHFDNAELKKLIIHRVGNKTSDEGYKLSDEVIDMKSDPDLARILTDYFLKPFEQTPFYNFTHASSLDLNEAHSLASKMFGNGAAFVKSSQEIGKILYGYSTHPKIRNGELYVAYFKNCFLHDKEVDAIGIFKSENKDTFLKPDFDGENYQVAYEDGVNINKLDKGCLILNSDREKGYVVTMVDNLNKSNEAQYWKDEFLKLRPADDDYHTTQNYLDVCKNFVTTQLEQEYEVNKTDKIDFLNKTVAYFKENDAFDEDHFLEQVFADNDVIQSFKSYKDIYAAEKEVALVDAFDISNAAVKKQSRVFKSVLKLDKNFHIYIHGNKELIEKGFDAKMGKSFYKIYFDEELE